MQTTKQVKSRPVLEAGEADATSELAAKCSARLAEVESSRRVYAAATAPSTKAELGQFHTPERIAVWMAERFRRVPPGRISLLDPGAGLGVLSVAFLERSPAARSASEVSVHAIERDSLLLPELSRHLEATIAEKGNRASQLILEGDFLELAFRWIKEGSGPRFSHAILNPPYRKIGVSSNYYEIARRIGARSTNLYSVFVALAVELLKNRGELVAITPRSFFNGSYFRDFRNFVLRRCALLQIHVFERRDRAFAEDGVLQENVIFHVQKGVKQKKVVVSRSSDHMFSDYRESRCTFATLVSDDDSARVIHLPSENGGGTKPPSGAASTLDELDLEVITGPVVDFRHREDLAHSEAHGAAPLIYSTNIEGFRIVWPARRGRKAATIVVNERTRRWLLPAGTYVVVRRFSSKEEARRVVAALLTSEDVPGSAVGIENHLNVFRQRRGKLNLSTAWGLIAYLNSQTVDERFRSMSGSTQVNASDLKQLGYPAADVLRALGTWCTEQATLSRQAIDEKVGALLCQG